MVKKIILAAIVVICSFIFVKGINAETLDTERTIQGITLPKGSEIYFYKSGKLHFVILPQDYTIKDIPCAKETIELYESGRFKKVALAQEHEIQGIYCAKGYIDFSEAGKLLHATLAQDKEIQNILCAQGNEIYFYESGKLKIATLAREHEIQGMKLSKGSTIRFTKSGEIESVKFAQAREIQGIKFSKGSEVYFNKSGELNLAVMAKETVIQGVSCAPSRSVYFYVSGKLKGTRLAQDQEIRGIPCAQGYYVELYESGKIKEATLAQDYKIQGMQFSKGSEIHLTESGKIELVKLAQAKEIQGIKLSKGNRVRFDESGNIVFERLEQNPKIQGILCDRRSIEFYESGKLKKTKLARNQEIQGIKLSKGNTIEFYESGKLMSIWLVQDQEIQGIKVSKGSSIYFYESDKIERAKLAQSQEIQGILCAKGIIEFFESGKLERAILAQNQEIQSIICAEGEEIHFYESGKLKQTALAQEQEIQGIPCAKGLIEFYESGKLKNAMLATNTKIQGTLCVKDSQIRFDESGELEENVIIAQKYLNEYDSVTIKYSNPRFLENNNIVCLKTIHCWNSWGSKPSFEEIKIIETNLNNLEENILFEIERGADEHHWEFDSQCSFDVDAKGKQCILEPSLDFENKESLKVTVINLKSKDKSTITRRGIGYRISPDGKSLIYGDMESRAYDYSNKKTIYLTDIGGKKRDAIYETKDLISTWDWVDDSAIAVYCESKENLMYTPYIEIIDIRSKKTISSVVTEYRKGSMLVGASRNIMLVDGNKLFIKKGTDNPALKGYENYPLFEHIKKLNEMNEGWACYTILGGYIGTSWSFDNKLTICSNNDGDLILTELKNLGRVRLRKFEEEVLKKGYKK